MTRRAPYPTRITPERKDTPMTRDEYLEQYGNCVTSRMRHIVARKDGSGVLSGDTVTDFRGQQWTFKFATRFDCREMGKTGKVIVADEFGRQREFYDSVFDLTVLMTEPGR